MRRPGGIGSSRSTITTISAVSALAAAPRAPMAMPRSAPRGRGRVDPVADHHHRGRRRARPRPRRPCARGRGLLPRGRGRDRRRCRPRRGGRRSPARSGRCAGAAQAGARLAVPGRLSARTSRPRAHRRDVTDGQRAGGAGSGDGGRDPPLHGGVRRRGCRARRPARTGPRLRFRPPPGHRQVEAAVPRRLDQRVGDAVLGGFGRKAAARPSRVSASCGRMHRDQPGAAVGQGAGLVEDQHADPSEGLGCARRLLIDAAPLRQDRPATGPPGPRDQRAGGGHHSALRPPAPDFARTRPGRAGDQEREQEPSAQRSRPAHHRGLYAWACSTSRRIRELSAALRSADYPKAGPIIGRHRLAGEGQIRRAPPGRRRPPIRRQRIAMADQQPVAGGVARSALPRALPRRGIARHGTRVRERGHLAARAAREAFGCWPPAA